MQAVCFPRLLALLLQKKITELSLAWFEIVIKKLLWEMQGILKGCEVQARVPASSTVSFFRF
jgi:hypothetical protein